MNTEKFEMVAKTFQGLEDVLAKEITELGGENVAIGKRMVSFEGDKELLYKANFRCRTALRILKPIFKFKASNTDEVYEQIKAFDWDGYLQVDQTFAIDSVVFSDEFKHSKFVTYRAKDAIVDYFTEKYEKRPSVRLNNADLSLNLHISHNHCTLSLDSSGESLHKRGYRVVQTEAPINEVLAAGMILKTGWSGESNFIDPMCGSGTLLVEAAMIATKTPPGIYRKEFAFERWNDYDEEMFDAIYNDDSQEQVFEHRIYGSDISPKAIDIATQNIKSAGLAQYITLQVKPFQQYTEAPQGGGVMVTNPPYGERITSRDLLGLYEMIGERLKHIFRGFDAWIISYQTECFDKIGLKPSAKIDLMNGALECEYRKYEIFDGTYKSFREEDGSLNKELPTDEQPFERKKRFDFKPTKRFGEKREGGEERGERKDFKPRGERRFDKGDRPDRGERKDFKPRGERRFDKGDRPERGDRKDFKPRGERRFDKGDRPDRGERKDFKPRGERRFDKGDRLDRGEREEAKPFEYIHGEKAFDRFVSFKKPSIDSSAHEPGMGRKMRERNNKKEND